MQKEEKWLKYIQFKDENVKLSDLFGEKAMPMDELSDKLEQYTNYLCDKYLYPDTVPKNSIDVEWKEYEPVFPDSLKEASFPLKEGPRASFEDDETLVSDIMGREALNRQEIFRKFFKHVDKNCILRR